MMSDLKAKIEQANQTAVKKMFAAQPMLVDVSPAIDVIPKMRKDVFLHAGPPTVFEKMCVPQQHALIGALMYEGMAKNAEEARKIATSGNIELSPSHHYHTTTSMGGITSASMPVFVLKDDNSDNVTFNNIYEGPEYDILKMGVYSDRVIENLRFIEKIAGPSLKAAIKQHGPLNFKQLISKALTMGDEIHTRNNAATLLFSALIGPAMVAAGVPSKEILQTFDLIGRSDQFSVHASLAASKIIADAARGIPYSTVVTALARNGVDVGIQIAGLGDDEWFTGPAQLWTGALWFGNYSNADACPDLGDSGIVECVGLGGMASAAAPVLIQMKGGTTQDAVNYQKKMNQICVAQNPDFTIPMLDSEGTPTGIDIRKVVATGITPVINSSIAHKNGLGQIGVGHAMAPIEAFENALKAFQKKYAE